METSGREAMICNIHGFCPYDVERIYKEHGVLTYQHIRGDYAIEIIDGDETIYITDFTGNYAAGWLPKNSTLVLKNNRIIYKRGNHNISKLKYDPPSGLPKKDYYDDFFDAIDEAVRFRCQDATLLLSSGHDSGTIAASIYHQDLPCQILSITGHENQETLHKRLVLFEDKRVVTEWDAQKDSHQVAAEHIDTPIMLSGLGADELYVSFDLPLYARFLKQSLPHYRNHNIQVRYPLNDWNVFREWRLLKENLRNPLHQKKAFTEYMHDRGFPIYKGQKISFALNS